MKPETIIPKDAGDEIMEVLVDGLQRDLKEDERELVDRWTSSFDKPERATIINMLKELLNKHKRHD
ncbi:hypothetical protein [Rossellomorea marisflavi]|uniref:hypothetical protein n=1 Tax=Rossellomorea marisflavi TaxID=189381 RepID=UPI00345B43A5